MIWLNISEDFLAISRRAVAEGITHILTKPHYKNGRWRNKKDVINQQVEILQQELDNLDIPLTLFPWQEVRTVSKLVKKNSENKIQFIDESRQYLLIEFPTTAVTAVTESLFFELQKSGMTLIIVHPKRNYAILTEPNELLSLVKKGALAQLTAGSYVESFGKKFKS